MRDFHTYNVGVKLETLVVLKSEHETQLVAFREELTLYEEELTYLSRYQVREKREIEARKREIIVKIEKKHQAIAACNEDLCRCYEVVLKDALLELDFNKPRKLFRKYIRTHRPLNPVLIRGTEYCGHNLLLQRLQKIIKKRLCEDKTLYSKPVILNFAQKTPSEETIWELVKDEFHLHSSPHPQIISQQIHQRLQTEHVLVYFDEIGCYPDHIILPIAGKFWAELCRHFQDLGNTPYRLFLFLLDRKHEAKYVYKTEDFYRHTNPIDNTEFLKLQIEPLTYGIVEEWFENKSDNFPNHFDQIENEISQLFTCEEVSILKVIERICQLCELKKVYHQLK